MLCKPRLLLLDELSLGLAPAVVDLVLDAVEKLRRTGIGIMLVEQMALSAVQLADRSYVFSTGTVVMAEAERNYRATLQLPKPIWAIDYQVLPGAIATFGGPWREGR